MGKKFLAALLAATTAASGVVPSIAAAQDRGDRGGPRVERSQQRQAQRPSSGGWQQRQSQGQNQRGPSAERQARQQSAHGNWQQSGRDRSPTSYGQRSSRPTAPDGSMPRLPQERRDDRASGGGGQRPGAWQSARPAPQGGQTVRPDRAREPSGNFRGRPDDRREFTRDRGDDRRDFSPDRRDNRRDIRRSEGEHRWSAGRTDWSAHRQWSGQRNGWQNGRGGWNRDWRRDARYDWGSWRSNNRNAFRLPRYYAPYGWSAGYRRFGVGAVLSSVLFTQSYWINDPWDYRLPEADGPYRWVRYYNDALLVDVYSGEVVDVINDIFW